MNKIFASLQLKRSRKCSILVALIVAAGLLGAQSPHARIAAEITSSEQSTVKGSQHPLAQSQNDAGRMPASTRLNGISLYFNRSAAQEADLQSLLSAQQNPASPLYHKWLTPDQFAVRFGMAQSDIDKVQGWLQQQGFSVESVARSRNMIRFSGTVTQVESAFATEMHYYTVAGAKHFAPATALSVPTAIASTVSGIRNLNDFRPRPQAVKPRAAYTSGQTGTVFFAPGDIVTTYDVGPLYSGGINGAGQTIAIAGQSTIALSDIEAFQNAAGITKKDPTLVLVPGTGDPAVSAGDEGESDIDVEWASSIATGANIVFVYTGSDTNFGVFDSVSYAVDQKLASIISLSYDSCELNLAASDFTTLEKIFQQAAAQGQSVTVASGDQGSTACFIENPPKSGDPPLATQEKVAVNYPASSAYTTAMGGTEIDQSNAAYNTQGQGYWSAQGSSDTITSALKYIPEQAWNDDDSTNGLSATGGGTSANIARPTWQAGVPGIASGSMRLVPDVSLYSSPSFPGFLYCTSDTSYWAAATATAPAQQASCNNGFRDASTSYFTVAGGTSFAAPIFASMIALINQKAGYAEGQGLINPTLYKLAANSSTYSSAFHDVTKGNNNCTAGTNFCAQTTGFAAGTGYDEVTGLGSVDLTNLANAWPSNSGTGAALIGTTTTVSASNSTPSTGDSVTFTITVAPVTGTGVPSGTVNISVDGGGTGYSNSGTTSSVKLSANGTATFNQSFSSSGTHTVVAQYGGDAAYATSTGSASVLITVVSSGKGSFAFSPTPSTLTVAQGSQGDESVTVTPAGGYTGLVNFTYTTPNTLTNLCVFAGTGINSKGSIEVPNATAVSATITLDTKASDCSSSAATAAKSGTHAVLLKRTGVARNQPAPKPFPNRVPAEIAFGGLLLAGFLGRHGRRFRSAAWVVVLAAMGFGLTACGSSSTTTSTTVTNPPKGTYTITLTGQDSVTATITTTATFTLKIN